MLFFGTRVIIDQFVPSCHQVEKIAGNNHAQYLKSLAQSGCV
jgi:hypothetical protein